MKSPFFSVVIPLYNKEETISETIHSVLSQTFDNFEVIVVNDGSRDNGPSVVGKIQDRRIIMVHQENAGVSAARNKGTEIALGEYIAFLDGDDKWKKNHLDPYVPPYIKINFRWISGLHVKTRGLLEGSAGAYL